MKSIVVGCLFSLIWLGLPANASADMTCSEKSCVGVPNRVLVYPNGVVNIFPTGDEIKPPTICQPVDGKKAVSLPDGDGKDRIYSTLLASMLSGKRIFLRLPDDDSTCVVRYLHMIND
jgi:hypothetical protein